MSINLRVKYVEYKCLGACWKDRLDCTHYKRKGEPIEGNVDCMYVEDGEYGNICNLNKVKAKGQ